MENNKLRYHSVGISSMPLIQQWKFRTDVYGWVKKEKPDSLAKKSIWIISTCHSSWRMFNIHLIDVHRNPKVSGGGGGRGVCLISNLIGIGFTRNAVRELVLRRSVDWCLNWRGPEKRIRISHRPSEHPAKSTFKALEICLFLFKYDKTCNGKTFHTKHS